MFYYDFLSLFSEILGYECFNERYLLGEVLERIGYLSVEDFLLHLIIYSNVFLAPNEMLF